MIQIHQGVDLVELPKFKSVFLNHKSFVSDIYTEKEREYCLTQRDPAIHFAGRFAVKEAFLKAIGRGISGSGIDHIFQEIEISQHASGKPVLSVSGWAAKISRRMNINQFTVSISHASSYAIATVILVGSKNTV
ncbi:holo-[acyl-carrier-protein] synthase [bacterium]|nr:MAG: holo-[acyl-carrier-protein] synthase [bacterium]